MLSSSSIYVLKIDEWEHPREISVDGWGSFLYLKIERFTCIKSGFFPRSRTHAHARTHARTHALCRCHRRKKIPKIRKSRHFRAGLGQGLTRLKWRLSMFLNFVSFFGFNANFSMIRLSYFFPFDVPNKIIVFSNILKCRHRFRRSLTLFLNLVLLFRNWY